MPDVAAEPDVVPAPWLVEAAELGCCDTAVKVDVTAGANGRTALMMWAPEVEAGTAKRTVAAPAVLNSKVASVTELSHWRIPRPPVKGDPE
jgi:hypothetical protein